MKEIDLNGRESFNVNIGEILLDLPEHLQIVVPLPIRVQPAGEVDLVNLRSELRQDVLDRHFISIGATRLCCKVTELAGQHTDVRWLDLLVEHEVHSVAALLPLNMMRHFPERDDVARPEQCDTIFQRQPVPALNLLPNRRKALVSKM